MLICPQCKGRGNLLKTETDELPCDLCEGKGTLSAEKMRQREHGREKQAERLTRRESLRLAAKRLGIDTAKLSQMERGVIPYEEPDPPSETHPNAPPDGVLTACRTMGAILTPDTLIAAIQATLPDQESAAAVPDWVGEHHLLYGDNPQPESRQDALPEETPITLSTEENPNGTDPTH